MATKKADIEKIISTMAFMPNSPLVGQNANIIAGIMEDFFQTLKDIDLQTLQAAVVQYKREEKFFPTPSGILEKAQDLAVIAQGLPTPSEAWGKVLEADKYTKPNYCDEAQRLARLCEDDPENYGRHLRSYSNHRDGCGECRNSVSVEDYGHPVVSETVKMLGGRSAIFTDNMTADRARFIEAYREIVAREKKKASMTPEVSQFVENKRQLYLQSQSEIKMLTDRMEK